ncbi:DUF5058 family protein [Natronococcus occultus]|uniref:DUF5058 domain-containing protein n=1 Tax=Natronococcus occultus SP4 TaxID=694430 RepID=L0K0Q6_9EURY|nr:DUF5058 family protein [Natronococcus occultus]AGB38862.1 hypothetical protein Natoc_3121 [Natronococcus occultus SP4]
MYMDIANSVYMWAAAGVVVLLVIAQAALFMRRAYRSGKEMGMDEDQLKTGLRAGMISAVGPAIAILIGMMALVATVGGAIAWMRLSAIGSVMFELSAAEFGTQQLGYSLGDDDLTEVAYANAVWVMTFGAVGWLVVSGLFTPQMENVRQRIGSGREALLPVVSAAAMLGAFGYLATSEVMSGSPFTASVTVGGLMMLGLLHVADRWELQWVREWALGTAMIVGLLAGVLTEVTLGGVW